MPVDFVALTMFFRLFLLYSRKCEHLKYSAKFTGYDMLASQKITKLSFFLLALKFSDI